MFQRDGALRVGHWGWVDGCRLVQLNLLSHNHCGRGVVAIVPEPDDEAGAVGNRNSDEECPPICSARKHLRECAIHGSLELGLSVSQAMEP